MAEHGALVVCGGRSSRMGRPKALLPWRGRTLIEHLVEGLSAVVGEVVVVTSSALDLPRLPVRVLVDEHPEQGPLEACLLYTSPSPRDKRQSRMPSSA